MAICLMLAVIAVIFLTHHKSKPEGGGGKEAAAHSPGGAAGGPVPVVTENAKQGEIGTYVEALGTVTPTNTVSIYSRVQGQITAVHYREGQLVKKGDPLIDIDPRPYEAAVLQAQGALERDRALLAEAQIDLKRYRRAYATRAIPQQQFQDQEQVVRQDEGAVQSDRGSLEAAQANLSYAHIVAPVSGRVGLRLVDAGNMVQANSTTALAVVTALSPITVVFPIAEDYLAQVQAGVDPNADPMTVEAWDRGRAKKLSTGLFLTLDNQIDPTTGTVRVRAMFDNEDGALFPNQFVNARLLVRTQANATIVKSEAVQRNTDGTFVYVFRPDKTVETRTVRVGTVEGAQTQILDGVKPGETVATSGFDKLQQGAKVSVQSPTPQASASPSPDNKAEENPHQLAGTTGQGSPGNNGSPGNGGSSSNSGPSANNGSSSKSP